MGDSSLCGDPRIARVLNTASFVQQVCYTSCMGLFRRHISYIINRMMSVSCSLLWQGYSFGKEPKDTYLALPERYAGKKEGGEFVSQRYNYCSGEISCILNSYHHLHVLPRLNRF